MLKALSFSKMHGLGNDYIVLNGTRYKIKLTPKLIRKLCDRNYGIGADGVILVLTAETQRTQRKTCVNLCESMVPDFKMRIFNADGSEAEMCGNGIRCLGKFVYDHGLTRKKPLKIDTLAGVKSLDLYVNKGKVNKVKVEMGTPRQVKNNKLKIKNKSLRITSVSMGNPHCVVFVRNVDKFPVEQYGPIIEKHRLFPNRTNVEFVQIINRGLIKQRTWERGVGETAACGTGASASVVAGVYNNLLNRKVTVQLKGGKLQIYYAPEGMVYLTGPTEEVFNGNI